jgi:hypothetical protein
MKNRVLLCGAVALAVMLGSVAVMAQEKGSGKQETQGDSMNMDAMMQAMAKYGSPSPAHKILEKMAGKWSLIVKMWMDPAAPPTESKGTSQCEMTLGGRWLREEVHSEFMAQPFIGVGLTGYDNFRQRYVGVWMDNMSTAPMLSFGSANAAGTELTFVGTMDAPATGEKDKKFRNVLRWTGPDQLVTEMYDAIPGKGEIKVMEITYTRAK